MKNAEWALQEAAANISAEVRARLETADALSEADRKSMIEIGRRTLERFQPKPETGPASRATAQPMENP
jgi:F-type H+-transporting ATPase subunit alpha